MRLAKWTFMLATAVIALGFGADHPVHAQSFNTITSIVGNNNSLSGLVQDAAGNFYGTSCCDGSGFGTVFKLDPSYTVSVLHTFAGGADGGTPKASLVLDAAGNLYGTTVVGGASGQGTVFKLDSSDTETVLYSFTGGTDGYEPAARLARDAAGNLYGTTERGGSSGFGTVFKVDATGVYSLLHSFTGVPDGNSPLAGVVLDATGNLYGTTSTGGVAGGECSTYGCGTVFKVDAANTETVLHSFTGGAADGAFPNAGLILDASGNLYGTTTEGGPSGCYHLDYGVIGNPCGVVFKLDIAGSETVLYGFTGVPDGGIPKASLFLDAAGNLYGTTAEGGSGPQTLIYKSAQHQIGNGTIFKVDPAGNETVLYSFTGQGDGGSPTASVIMDTAGNLYGSAANTVFILNPTGPPAVYPLTATLAGNGSGTVTANPPDINCPGLCSASIATGTAVTLTATAAAGSMFAGWSGACSGMGACSVTMNSATIATSTFTLPQDFSLSATALSPSSISAGMSSTSTVNVAAVNAFSSAVALTCVVAPTPALAPTCSVSPSSVMPGAAATLTVHTTAPTSQAMSGKIGSRLFFALYLPMLGLVVTRVSFGSKQKRRKGKLTAAALTCLLFSGLAFQLACGGSLVVTSSKGTPSGAYTITVTGTYATGSLVHNTPVTLTVR